MGTECEIIAPSAWRNTWRGLRFQGWQYAVASPGVAAGYPFSAATDLRFAGFSFSLFKPVLGMGGAMAIRAANRPQWNE